MTKELDRAEHDGRCLPEATSACAHSRRLGDHIAMLRNYARRVVKHSEDAAEVVQEAALTILSHRTGPRDPEAFAAWCRGILRIVAVRHCRAQMRRNATVVLLDVSEWGCTPLDAESRIAAREQLARLLLRVDARARELLVRRYLLGESATDIAAESRRTPAAVRMSLMRLRGVVLDEPDRRPVSWADRRP